MFKGPIIQPTKAVEAGLIDGIKTCDELMGNCDFDIEQTFSGAGVHEVMKKSRMDKVKKMVGM